VAWVVLSAGGDGVGVDETPEAVIDMFESTTDDWVRLHDRGRATFVDPKAVYAVWPDDEEIEKEANIQLAAEAAAREGKEVAS
jgi:hypothetical protein